MKDLTRQDVGELLHIHPTTEDRHRMARVVQENLGDCQEHKDVIAGQDPVSGDTLERTIQNHVDTHPSIKLKSFSLYAIRGAFTFKSENVYAIALGYVLSVVMLGALAYCTVKAHHGLIELTNEYNKQLNHAIDLKAK